ncbi:MAG: glutaredoxin family protein [Patescibacteria group bacterium]|nr:glutaredoxin family protein [Patescibacteria group bacterium]
MQQQKLTIYTNPTCHFCKEAKAYFKENNIPYEEKDVLADASARAEMIEKSHQMGVPVIMVGDEFMVGFERNAVQKWLDLHMK